MLSHTDWHIFFLDTKLLFIATYHIPSGQTRKILLSENSGGRGVGGGPLKWPSMHLLLEAKKSFEYIRNLTSSLDSYQF